MKGIISDKQENKTICLTPLYFLEIANDLKINNTEEISAINQKTPIAICINKLEISADDT
jgi:hypothetical protein